MLSPPSPGTLPSMPRNSASLISSTSAHTPGTPTQAHRSTGALHTPLPARQTYRVSRRETGTTAPWLLTKRGNTHNQAARTLQVPRWRMQLGNSLACFLPLTFFGFAESTDQGRRKATKRDARMVCQTNLCLHAAARMFHWCSAVNERCQRHSQRTGQANGPPPAPQGPSLCTARPHG